MKHDPRGRIQRLPLARAMVAERRPYARLRGRGQAPRECSPVGFLRVATALARRAFGGKVHVFCKGRRTMACTITSVFLIAMFGIVAAAAVFRPGTKEKPSARRQETPIAPSGDRVIA
jgi:hypothetical protein